LHLRNAILRRRIFLRKEEDWTLRPESTATVQIQQDPDLIIGSLKIWILGYQFPLATDYWDGNWLIALAECEADGMSASIQGAFLHSSDLVGWLARVEKLQRTFSGQVELPSIEPNLRVTITSETRGRMFVEVAMTNGPVTKEHRFTFHLERSLLFALATSLRRILLKYPVKAGL
jgi:hypothetical protein